MWGTTVGLDCMPTTSAPPGLRPTGAGPLDIDVCVHGHHHDHDVYCVSYVEPGWGRGERIRHFHPSLHSSHNFVCRKSFDRSSPNRRMHDTHPTRCLASCLPAAASVRSQAGLQSLCVRSLQRTHTPGRATHLHPAVTDAARPRRAPVLAPAAVPSATAAGAARASSEAHHCPAPAPPVPPPMPPTAPAIWLCMRACMRP